ncbi:MAG: glycosyltransferase family 4 protein [Anaerolineae bacterium]|nr:glycosyltransferase family 4 protein [Anaerolineae bacterium]
MRIGFVATRLAGVDGVSLETAKLVTVLERMGHETFYCAGELEPGSPPGMLVPEMHFQHPMIQDIQRKAFDGVELMPGLDADIRRKAAGPATSLHAFIEDFRLDLLIVQNASAIPMHLPLGVAIHDVIKETGIPAICHNHDLYWERERFLVNRIPGVLQEAFPPVLPSVQHAVISTVMQRELHARTGVEPVYIPNVFDFENPPEPPDEYSQGFREDMGFGPDDVILLQPTRLIARKNIERAVELVRLLGAGRTYRLVVTGTNQDEPGPYFEWLFDQAVRAGIDVHFIGDRIGARRDTVNGQRIYTMWDIYPQADLITYLSSYEGFGNALIETLYFKRPLVVNLYMQYRSDIRPTGVQAVEVAHYVTSSTAVEVLDLLDDRMRLRRMVEDNYLVGLEHFSYKVLERRLSELLSNV